MACQFILNDQSTVKDVVEWLTDKGFSEEVGQRFEHEYTVHYG